MECKNGGSALNVSGEAFCACQNGFVGPQCDYVQCENGASSITVGEETYCYCPTGYTGSNCANKIIADEVNVLDEDIDDEVNVLEESDEELEKRRRRPNLIDIAHF